MKVEIDIPYPELPQGAIITDGHVIYCVQRFFAEGKWEFSPVDNPPTLMFVTKAGYYCVSQTGSVERGRVPEGHVRRPVRPGVIVFFDQVIAESMAKVPEFDRSLLVPGDNESNIFERCAQWDEAHPRQESFCTNEDGSPQTRFLKGDVVCVFSQPPNVCVDMKGMVGVVEYNNPDQYGRIPIIAIDEEGKATGAGSVPPGCLREETRKEWLDSAKKFEEWIDRSRNPE